MQGYTSCVFYYRFLTASLFGIIERFELSAFVPINILGKLDRLILKTFLWLFRFPFEPKSLHAVEVDVDGLS